MRIVSFMVLLTACSRDERAGYTKDNPSEVEDLDGDGQPDAEDCAPDNPMINSGATDLVGDGVDQNCDGIDGRDNDLDGVASILSGGDDCDDSDPDSTTRLEDADCDGLLTREDCNDNDALVTNTNVNDADCDLVITSEDCDDNDSTSTTKAIDADCDGVLTADDCDDVDSTVYPGALELCDGLDNACSGTLPSDEEDYDGDGYVVCSIDVNGWDGDVSVVGGDDCSFNRGDIHPDAAYNELPGECTRDQDGDGWGAFATWAGNVRGTDCDDTDATSTHRAIDADCDGVLTVDDCDDLDPTVFPGATEVADDGIDQDCDGVDVTSGICGLTNCDTNLDLGGGQSIDMVLIPNGTFTMGSPNTEVGRYSDEVQHQVILTNDYYMMTTEVTQGMFAALMGYQSYDGKNTSNTSGSYGVGNDYPAYYVSWHMAADFANKVTQRHNTLNGTNLQECYSCTGATTSVTCSVSVNPYQCTGYRMLTEAEWEYAARAGTTAAFWTPNGGGNIPSGYENNGGCSESWTLSDGTVLGDMAWFCGNNSNYNSAYPYGSKEVATQDPNGYGLYDMSGNLWEWTQDWYGAYSTGSVTNPAGITSIPIPNRVIRGSTWNRAPNSMRSAFRLAYTPTGRYAYFGFRLALTP